MNTHQHTARHLAFAAAALTTTLANAQSYRVTHVNPSPTASASWAWDINNDARVSGGFALADHSSIHGFYWDDGVTMDLPPFPSNNTRYCEAFAVNVNGVVVGEASIPAFPSTGTHGFVTFDGVAPNLLDPLPNNQKSQLNDANGDLDPWATGWTDTGQIMSGSGSLMHHAALILLDGNLNQPIDLGTLGGPASWGNAINIFTDVAGGSLTAQGPMHAALWTVGSVQDLGTLGGAASEATDLNDQSLVVGWAQTTSGQTHAMSYENGAMKDLGTLGGHTSKALGVNQAGDIVGMSYGAQNQIHAFVYRGQSMMDLNDLISPQSGWVLQYAEAINDNGQIVGRGRFAGKEAAFILTPEAACYADCDTSTGVGVLDVFDFLCFQNAFVSGDPYACDCDTSTGPLVCDVFDFLCFQDAFVAGCP
jgi:probable HAF family extracellular repeat protein